MNPWSCCIIGLAESPECAGWRWSPPGPHREGRHGSCPQLAFQFRLRASPLSQAALMTFPLSPFPLSKQILKNLSLPVLCPVSCSLLCVDKFSLPVAGEIQTSPRRPHLCVLCAVDSVRLPSCSGSWGTRGAGWGDSRMLGVQ